MKQTKYSGDLKLSVLNYRQIHPLSYRETAEHFGINNTGMIANWQRLYNQLGLAGLNRKQGRQFTKGVSKSMPKNQNNQRSLTPSELEELISLREKNLYLEAELACLKKLDALIQEKSQTKRKRK